VLFKKQGGLHMRTGIYYYDQDHEEIDYTVSYKDNLNDIHRDARRYAYENEIEFKYYTLIDE
jgi:hypothetical protein